MVRTYPWKVSDEWWEKEDETPTRPYPKTRFWLWIEADSDRFSDRPQGVSLLIEDLFRLLVRKGMVKLDYLLICAQRAATLQGYRQGSNSRWQE